MLLLLLLIIIIAIQVDDKIGLLKCSVEKVNVYN